jgi:carboxypeptidase C (cathepsin A)
MTWPGLAAWKQASETPIYVGNIPQGFVRTYQNFAFYRIFRAGHMVKIVGVLLFV